MAAKKEASAKQAKVVNLGYEVVDVSTLKRHPKNFRRGDVDVIEESIGHNGFYGAIVARRADRTILAGHHRMDAAVRAGLKELPVVWVRVDDRAAARIVAADNRSNDLASYDREGLGKWLSELKDAGDLLGTGFDDVDVEKLVGVEDELETKLPSGSEATRSVQLFFTIEQHEEFNRLTQDLAVRFKLGNVTDVVLEAIRRVVAKG